MAVNDIELNVGVKFDEAEFIQAYQSALSKTSAATQQVVDDGITKLKGSAAPDWNTLPYTTMHDASSGQRTAAKAFLASLAHDLNFAGITSKSQGFSAAMTNAAYISAIPDTTERFRRLRAEGLYNEAALTAPGSALAGAIESDYALMQQGWSRNFIKSRKNKAGIKEAYVDFAGMREYAVDEGLGKWIDEDMPHTADNFELINEELENIEDKSKKSEKTFLGWNDTLKGVLGTLTAIGSLAGIVKTFEVAYKASEAGTVAAGTTLDKRRAFIGMSALDELKTKVASKSVGLGEDAIKNEIYSMSGNIEQYKLLGQGDALPPALLGIFNNLMTAEDPYDIYTKSADELYKQLKGADAQTRRRWLMLMNKAGLGSMSSLVGQFLSNPEYAKQYGTPSALFNLKSNPYYSVYPEAETMLPQISKLNESLKASYNQMYKDWEKAFGIPFKTWWDETLKNKVVPWFERVLEIAGIVKDSSTGDANAASDFDKAWDKALKKQQKANSVSNREKISGYWSLAARDAFYLNDKVSWESFSPDTSLFVPAAKTKVVNINDANPKTFLNALEVMTKDTSYAPGTIHEAFQSRAEVAWNFLKTTGLYNDLNDLRTTDVDKYTMRVIKEYLAEGNMNILDTYLSEAYTKSEGWKELLEFIREYKVYLKQHPEQLNEKVELLFNGYGGEKLLEEAKKELNR